MPLPNRPEGVLTVNDFSPGIYSFGVLVDNTPPAPLGAAQELNTYGCIALPGGGLGPLPRCEVVNSGPVAWDASAADDPLITVAGIARSYAVPAQVILASPSAEKYYAYTLDSGTAMVLQQWESLGGAITNYARYDGIGDTGFGGDLNFGRTQDAAAVAAGTTGSHVFGGLAYVMDGANKNVAFEYHSHSTRWKAMKQGDYFGEVFLFGQRNNLATGIPDAQFIFYDQAALLDSFLQLDGLPGGLTYGVISTGEFLIVTRNRGAVRIAGTFEFPQITELPGVVPTGIHSMRAVPTSIGLLYCVHGVGVFSWNGSNTADFVSPQLRSSFFERPTPSYDLAGNGQSVQAARWGQWAAFPNNWLFNPTQGSWWRLSDSEDLLERPGAVFWNGQFDELYAMPDSVPLAGFHPLGVMKWNREVLCTYYSWQSHGIPVTSHGKLVEIYDIEIRLTSTSLTSQSVVLSLRKGDGSVVTETFQFGGITTRPVRLRKTTFCQAYDIMFRIEATNNDEAQPAPIVHSVSLAWREAGPFADAPEA